MANTRHQSLGLGMSSKRTRKRVFLEEMDRVVPWRELVELLAAYRINAGRGRPPFTVEVMLRIHFMQHWVNLSDPAMEEALHNTALFREFAGLGGGGTRSWRSFPKTRTPRFAQLGRIGLRDNSASRQRLLIESWGTLPASRCTATHEEGRLPR